jgi:hypothetical protein
LLPLLREQKPNAYLLHKLANACFLPKITWGSEIWWTGSPKVKDKFSTNYNRIARFITGLPLHTRTTQLLLEAHMPPPHLLLDRKSQSYGVRVLLSGPDNPAYQTLLSKLPTNTNRNCTGLTRIAALLSTLLAPLRLERSDQQRTFISHTHLHIPNTDKETTAKLHNDWLQTIPEAWLLYTDGSKSIEGICSSGAHLIHYINGTPMTTHSTSCCIGPYSENEDAEIHAIQEGIHLFLRTHAYPKLLHICVDNQNAIRALAGGPTSNREHLHHTLLLLSALDQLHIEYTIRWTPSHLDITGNNKADQLAKDTCNKAQCQWARSTLGWLRLQPHAHMMREWTASSPHQPSLNSSTPQRTLTRHQSTSQAKVRTGTTSHDFHPKTINPTCPCGQNDSNIHRILGCSLFQNARQNFFGNETPSMELLFHTKLDLGNLFSFAYELDLM